MEIVINPDLKRLEPYNTERRAEFINVIPGKEMEKVLVDGRGWPEHRVKRRDIIRDTIPIDDVVLHRGYFGYFAAAYEMHFGVVVDPTFIWYTLLSECATHIKENAEHYRPLFSTSAEKQEITITGNAEVHIDPQEFLPQLRALVPVGVDLFLPEFSTATHGYDVAAAAAFCEAVSPYYNYSMMLCGIRSVRVTGTVEDWDRVLAHLDGVAGRLDKASAYFATVRVHIAKMRAASAGEVDVAFWKDIYSTERCGSGGQVQVLGWFKDFAMTQPRHAYPENYPTHTAKIEVTQEETGRKYTYCAGMFSSRLDGDFLVPSFSSVVERQPAVAVTAAPQPSAP